MDEAGRVVAAGPADKRAGAHEQLPSTQGRLLLHRGEEKERRIDSSVGNRRKEAVASKSRKRFVVQSLAGRARGEPQLCPKQAALLLFSGFVTHASLAGSVSY